MAQALDYGASVPMSTAPFRVKISPDSMPPGDRGYKDFIPKEPSKPAAPVEKKQDNVMRVPHSRFGEDYISGEDNAARKHNDMQQIKLLAKELFKSHQSKKAEYDAAIELVSKATPEQKANPSAELSRAMRIAKKLRPLTKEEAIEKATIQFYGNR